MTELESIRTVKAREMRRLLQIPGAHGVGVGAKVVGGHRTEEPALAVFVVEKKPLAQLHADHVIPPEIDGIKTDVIESPRMTFTTLPDMIRERPLVGGVLMTIKDTDYKGTLGCFGRTKQGQAVAITCHHVVAPRIPGVPTKLTLSQPQPPPHVSPYARTFQGQNTPGTVIAILLKSARHKTDFATYVTTGKTDALKNIATNVMRAVNQLTAAHVTATIGATPAQVVITTNQGFDTPGVPFDTLVEKFDVYSPIGVDPKSELIATVDGNSIEFSGKADGQYGVYVIWSVAGSDASQGSFTAIDEDSTLEHVASAVVSSIFLTPGRDVDPDLVNGKVVLNNATIVTCQVIHDLRAGQPSDGFCSDCSLCCNDDFGRVILADPSVDAALIHIRSGIEYRDEIKEDPDHGFPNRTLTGAYTPTDQQIKAGYPVSKRGWTTGITSGEITHEASFIVDERNPAAPAIFGLLVEHVYVITTTAPPFAKQGDSGAAVYDAGGKVVAILFGTNVNTGVISVATPIQKIQERLEVTVEGATALNPTHNVTDADGSHSIIAADDSLRRMLEAQTEISAMPAGKNLSEAVLRNVQEVQDLVNTNMRVATAWHRNGGPMLVKVGLRYLQERNLRLPDEIDGLSVAQRLQNIQKALVRFGSKALASDLERYGPMLVQLTGMTFGQALDHLRTQEAF